MIGELIGNHTVKLLKELSEKQRDDQFWRKFFAGMAMQAQLTGPENIASYSKLSRYMGVPPKNLLAQASIEFADALITELNKTEAGE